MSAAAAQPADQDAILIEPLAPAVGLSIGGISLHALDDGLTAMLQDMWQLGGALLFRGVENPQQAVIALSQALVPEGLNAATSPIPGGTAWSMVGADDSSTPPLVCAVAVETELPPLWLAGMEAAADALHLTGADMLTDSVGMHFAHRANGPSHPGLARHAVSGASVLYPPPRALAGGNTAALALVQHAEQPQFLYRHVWQTGDVLAWDPRAVRSRWEAMPADASATFVTVPGTSPLQPATTWPPEPFL